MQQRQTFGCLCVATIISGGTTTADTARIRITISVGSTTFYDVLFMQTVFTSLPNVSFNGCLHECLTFLFEMMII